MALLDVQIDALSLGRRGNWTVATSDGISIRLGGEYIHERLGASDQCLPPTAVERN